MAANIKTIIEQRFPLTIKLLDRKYISVQLDWIKLILHHEDARASRLSQPSYNEYVEQANKDWDKELNIGCCVL